MNCQWARTHGHKRSVDPYTWSWTVSGPVHMVMNGQWTRTHGHERSVDPYTWLRTVSGPATWSWTLERSVDTYTWSWTLLAAPLLTTLETTVLQVTFIITCINIYDVFCYVPTLKAYLLSYIYIYIYIYIVIVIDSISLFTKLSKSRWSYSRIVFSWWVLAFFSVL